MPEGIGRGEIADCEFRIADCEFRIADFAMRRKQQAEDREDVGG
jgi:hypothetical protein